MRNDYCAATLHQDERAEVLARAHRGFTLAELLIAVAIIGSLVSISLPMFSSQQGYSRRRADEANYNAAKEAATAVWLASSMPDGASYCYDLGTDSAKPGTAEVSAPAGYGLSTPEDWTTETFTMKATDDENPTYPADSDGTPHFVRVTFDSHGITEAVWSD